MYLISVIRKFKNHTQRQKHFLTNLKPSNQMSKNMHISKLSFTNYINGNPTSLQDKISRKKKLN
jgi:hypothetical protein